MFRDESIYPTPETFDPERFIKDGKLDPSVRDPEERIFGAGRRCGLCYYDFLVPRLRPCRTDIFADRICPGRFFAMRIIFLNVACILNLFDIGAPINEKLEANFDEERIIRHVTISLLAIPVVSVMAVTDVCLKETGSIQVYNNTSL